MEDRKTSPCCLPLFTLHSSLFTPRGGRYHDSRPRLRSLAVMPSPGPRRPARFQAAWLAFLASLALLAGLITLLAFNPFAPSETGPRTRPLVVFCAAGLRKPVEE